VITEGSGPQQAVLAPCPDRSVVAIEPPGAEPGHWAGAPSAVSDGDEIVLAYRLRRPLGQGRGYAVVIARSPDGVTFETLQVIGKQEMDTESLERPALVVTPDGTWRLYVSCATRGTKHWRVELLEAAAPGKFDPAQRRVVLPGDGERAVKDPVIRHHSGTWHLWASVHPLADPASTDRMTTDYATSQDGVSWTWHGHALQPRAGQWDSRGVRVSTVQFTAGGVTAFYDGRASEQENYEERTGLATGTAPGSLTAAGTDPVAQGPDGSGLRYLDIVSLGDGHERWYYELTRPDGLHELRTELR
jgi:sucrose-6-phosphate hydrolase SacC (GH32 family)